MISELKIRNFKSLESVDLKLGHFNLLVGANASGKSNFLDALRFVQGVGNRFNIGEILDGKPRTDTRVLWGGIRGGSKFVAFRKLDGQQAKRTDFDVSFQDDEIIGSFGEPLRYKVCFSASADAPYVVEDSLSLQNPDVATTLHVNYTSGSEETSTRVHQEKSPPSGLSKFRFADRDHGPFPSVLNGYIPKKLIDGSNEFFDLEHAADNLSSMQFLDPLPAVLRDYSSKVWRLGEDGEGFAALIHEIESNGSKPALLEWLKELRPDEVDESVRNPRLRLATIWLPSRSAAWSFLRPYSPKAPFASSPLPPPSSSLPCPRFSSSRRSKKACIPAVCGSCSN